MLTYVLTCNEQEEGRDAKDDDEESLRAARGGVQVLSGFGAGHNIGAWRPPACWQRCCAHVWDWACWGKGGGAG